MKGQTEFIKALQAFSQMEEYDKAKVIGYLTYHASEQTDVFIDLCLNDLIHSFVVLETTDTGFIQELSRDYNCTTSELIENHLKQFQYNGEDWFLLL